VKTFLSSPLFIITQPIALIVLGMLLQLITKLIKTHIPKHSKTHISKYSKTHIYILIVAIIFLTIYPALEPLYKWQMSITMPKEILTMVIANQGLRLAMVDSRILCNNRISAILNGLNVNNPSFQFSANASEYKILDLNKAAWISGDPITEKELHTDEIALVHSSIYNNPGIFIAESSDPIKDATAQLKTLCDRSMAQPWLQTFILNGDGSISKIQ
jgi:uncharacterized protein YpmB